jgi:cytochrome P450
VFTLSPRSVIVGQLTSYITSYVPEGTQVAAHFYSLFRNSEYFSPLPDTFWPDRWLTQEEYILPTGDAISKDKVVINRNALVPFSLGPQNCPGKALAWMEMRAVVCGIMHRFDLRRANDYDLDAWEKSLIDVYVTLRGKLPGILMPRKT